MPTVERSPETFTISAGATLRLETTFDGGADKGPVWTMVDPDGDQPVNALLTVFGHSKCHRIPEEPLLGSGRFTPEVFYECEVHNRSSEAVSFHLQFMLP